MLDLDHLTITKTKPKPKRKLATVNNCIEFTDAIVAADDDDDDDTTVTTVAIAVANISKSHIHNATYANRPTKKPFSSNALPFTSSSPKQCTYKNLTHCLWIYLILSFCLPKCKCNFIE